MKTRSKKYVVAYDTLTQSAIVELNSRQYKNCLIDHVLGNLKIKCVWLNGIETDYWQAV